MNLLAGLGYDNQKHWKHDKKFDKREGKSGATREQKVNRRKKGKQLFRVERGLSATRSTDKWPKWRPTNKWRISIWKPTTKQQQHLRIFNAKEITKTINNNNHLGGKTTINYFCQFQSLRYGKTELLKFVAISVIIIALLFVVFITRKLIINSSRNCLN